MTREKTSETEKSRLISFELIQPIKPTPHCLSLRASVCAPSANLAVCATPTCTTWSKELFKHPVNYSEASAVCWTNFKTDCTLTFYIWSYVAFLNIYIYINLFHSVFLSVPLVHALTPLGTRLETRHVVRGRSEINASWVGWSCTDERCLELSPI